MSDTLELLHQLDKRIDRTIETMGNLERENIELKKQISEFNLCGNTVAKSTYNEVVNENAILKAAISKMEITTEKNSEVEELKKQIEKMKCCYNCKYVNFNNNCYCHRGIFNANGNYICDEWEFAE